MPDVSHMKVDMRDETGGELLLVHVFEATPHLADISSLIDVCKQSCWNSSVKLPAVGREGARHAVGLHIVHVFN